MWELSKRLSHGRISLRNCLTFVTSLFVAVFMLNTVVSDTVLAISEVRRSGSNIVADGVTLSPGDTITSNDSRPGIPGTYAYTATDPTKREAYFLFIPADVDHNTATEGNYAVYEYSATGTYGNRIRGPDIVQILPDDGSAAANAEATGGCNSAETKGLGWMLCPITNFLATGMDRLYGILVNFLVVQPATASTDSPLYSLWVVVRDIANVLFVIAFLVMVYSQLSSFGLSNYGIKKILPRLILAAILVNASYWICALAIDLSNTLGYQVYNFFIVMYNSILANGSFSMSWGDLGALILAGGVGATIGTAALISATAAGTLALFVPMLLTVVFAAIVAIVVLATRQALITILVIVSPLAFVAYTLPNTEKWFEKWRSTLTTMLLLFPIFSAIFGGAQLAGAAIIETARGNNMLTATTLIFGMAVQVAPVVITPLLVRFSGNLVGKIAGMVNNPQKGLLDRTRNWAKERAAYEKDRVLAGEGNNGTLNRASRRFAANKTRRERERKAFSNRYAAWLNSTEEGERTFNEEKDAERDLKASTDRLTSRRSDIMQNNAGLMAAEINARIEADEATVKNAQIDSIYEEAKAGDSRLLQNQGAGYLNVRAAEIASDIAKEGLRKQQAEEVRKSNFTDELQEQNSAALRYAAGIGGKDASDKILASAVSQERREFEEAVNAQVQLLKHFKVDSPNTVKLALGEDDYTATDARGHVHEFKIDNDYVREAAISEAGKVGSHNDILKIVEASGKHVNADGTVTEGVTYKYRDTVQAMVLAKGFGKIAPAVNDKALNEILNGEYDGRASTVRHTIREIAEGRLTMDTLASANVDSLKIAYATADMSNPMNQAGLDVLKPEDRALYWDNYSNMKGETFKILTNSNIRRGVTRESIREMLQFLRGTEFEQLLDKNDKEWLRSNPKT